MGLPRGSRSLPLSHFLSLSLTLSLPLPLSPSPCSVVIGSAWDSQKIWQKKCNRPHNHTSEYVKLEPKSQIPAVSRRKTTFQTHLRQSIWYPVHLICCSWTEVLSWEPFASVSIKSLVLPVAQETSSFAVPNIIGSFCSQYGLHLMLSLRNAQNQAKRTTKIDEVSGGTEHL